MGTRYTWVRALITTENRDRPGGHGYTYATDGLGYREPYLPAGARFAKRRTRRTQRREHARITREAIQSFYEDQKLDLYESMFNDLDDDYLSFVDDFTDWEDYENNRYDYYEGDYLYDPYDDCRMDWYGGYGETVFRKEDPHDRIIKHEDAGKSLGDLLQEILDRRT